MNKDRSHVVRMLTRALRRRAQADRLVAKWTKRLAEINRQTTDKIQPQLWRDEDNPAEPNENAVHGAGVNPLM